MMRAQGRTHAPRSDQALRAAGLRAHPGGARDGLAAGSSFAGAPRFVMFFKGGSFHSPTYADHLARDLAGTPIAPLAPHAQDCILFTGMSIHGGSPKSDGYQEEHAAGLIGCSPATATTTRRTTRTSRTRTTSRSTSRSPITTRPCRRWRRLPFASLHIGAGAHSDADNVGLGQRYISFRKRQAGDSHYGNAIEPIQDAGQVYDS